MKIMNDYIKLMHLMVMLCVSMMLWGQEDTYLHEPEQKAIKTAFKILKIYSPAEELCISDSIHNLYNCYWPFKEMVDNETAMKIASADLKYDNPDIPEQYYSENISRLFSSDTYADGKKNIALFSEPYKGMFLCLIKPIDHSVYNSGSYYTIIQFLFRYDEDGEIYQFTTDTKVIDVR